jgi:hypothetical protein
MRSNDNAVIAALADEMSPGRIIPGWATGWVLWIFSHDVVSRG